MELTVELAFTIAYAAIMIAALIGNTLLIYIVWKKLETRSLTSFFFVNMAVADLLVAVFQMPQAIVHFNVSEMSPSVGVLACQCLFYLVNVLTTASIFSLVVMAFDRYYAVIHPLRRRIWFRKAKIIIPVIWVASWALMAVTPAAYELKKGKCHVTEEHIPRLPFWTYLFLINYMFPLAVISVLYVAVAGKIWFHEIPGQDGTTLNEPIEHIPKKKVVRMLIIVVVVFAVCWLPLQALQMDYAVKGSTVHYKLIYFSQWLSQANSAINPWLYIKLNGKMNAAFIKIIPPCRRENRRRCKASSSTFRSSATTTTVL